MDRRFLLAVVLMIAVLALPSLFMKRPVRPVTRADSTRVVDSARPDQPQAAPRTPEMRAAPVLPSQVAADSAADLAADSAVLSSADAHFTFSSAGAALIQASFDSFPSFHPGERGTQSRLIRPGRRMLGHSLVTTSDTVRFAAITHSLTQAGDALRFSGAAGGLTQTMTVRTVPGLSYVVDVSGEIAGLEGRGGLLIVDLGQGFANVEGDSMDNYRNYGVAARRDRPQNVNFRSVRAGERRELPGPFDWVAVKSKYFIGALMSADSTRAQIGGAQLTGMEREGKGNATQLDTRVTMPVNADGRFAYRLYLGPQTHRALSPLGRQLDQASPYGWIFRPIVMPVAGLITRLFLWMHENLRLSFGWVLVVFGILVRLVLWPLNQKAMKSQVAMMAVQPILKDIQTRYKNDPQKLQQEMMKTYKEHHVNPLGGCLPLLIPMPVLLALFFVFNRAIELRGEPFLWLPDLSLRDPYFITPVVMGLSMFALSKMSSAGMPPNPQTKMLTIFMPIMMTVLFLNFASGLNLYYAVSNIVSLPQQWLINKSRTAEMARRQVGTHKKS